MDTKKLKIFAEQFVQKVERTEATEAAPRVRYDKLTELEQEMRHFQKESDVWEEVNNSSTRYDRMYTFRDALTPALNRALYAMALEAAEKPECCEAFRAAAIGGYPARFDLLAVAGDAESFKLTCEDALKNLKASYYESNTASLEALTVFAQRPEYRQAVTELMGIAFEVIENSDADDGMINHVMYCAVARCMAQMKNPAFLPELLKAFEVASDDDAHYSLNREAGTIAMAMAALDYRGDTASLEGFLKSYEWRYRGEEFILKTRYALWIIRQDAAGAMAYLEERENTKSLGLAATALADLNAKDGLPIIKERFDELKDTVTKEVFKEAIYRLSMQKEVPAVDQRMIHLFGSITSTQLVLGWETDNQFIRRARQVNNNENMGKIYEDDESTNEDC